MIESKNIKFVVLALFIIGIGLSYPLSSLHVSNSPNSSNWLGEWVLGQYFVLTMGMLLAWKSRCFNENVTWLMVLGISARIGIIPVDPYLSNDVARYLFDGYIAGIGLDPYQISHDHSTLSEAVAWWNPPSEHLKYPTLYPPLAVGLFSLGSHWGPEVAYWVWKSLTALASIGVMFVSLILLKRLDKIQHFSLVALSPILILESGIGMHLDVFCALAVLGAVLCWFQEKWIKAGFLVGIGALIKLLPVILLVPLVGALRNWDKSVKLLFSAIITIIVGYGLAVLGGWKPVGSIGVFIEKFRFGSLLYSLFEPIWGFKITGIVSLVVLLIGYLLLFLKANKGLKQPQQVILLVQVALILPLITGPVVYPWYLLPLIPMLAIFPNNVLLVWTILQPLTYEVLSAFNCCRIWAPEIWPLSVIYGSLILVAMLEYKKLSKGRTKFPKIDMR